MFSICVLFVPSNKLTNYKNTLFLLTDFTQEI